jgi:DNA-binding NarL/FixJ family response regulator
MTGLDERPYALTQREAEVLCLLAHGKSCHQIAGELFISLPTVRNHVHNFLRKLDVHSQVEAVARAFREGLV